MGGGEETRPGTGAAVRGGEIRGIGRHAVVYGAGIAISKLAGFLMLPIYTRLLTPADYGVLELLSMTIDLLGTIAGVGLASSVFKFYADHDPGRDRNEVVSTAALAVTAIAALTALAGMVGSGGLAGLLLDTGEGPLYFRIFFLIYLANTAETIPLLYMRAVQRSGLFVLATSAKLLLMLTANIYFVVVLRMGVLGVLAGNLLATTISAAALSAYLFREVGFAFSPTKLRAMARFGYPLMLVYVGNFALVFSDRYFLNHFHGARDVGLYSLAYKFAFVLSAFAATPFQMVWAPQRFMIAKRPDAPAVFRRVFLYLNVVLGIVALGIALFARDVIAVMADPAFQPAYHVVPLLVVAQIIHHWAGYANLGFFLRERTGDFARSSFVGAAAVLVLNLLLIPRWGVQGAAWATLGGYAARFVAVYIAAQKHYPIDYGWGEVARFYAVLGVAFGVRARLGELPLVASVGTSALLAVAAVIVAYRVVLNPEEQARIRRTIPWPRRLVSREASG